MKSRLALFSLYTLAFSLFLFILLLTPSAFSANANVLFNTEDLTTQVITGRNLTLTPLSTPRASGGAIISSDKKVYKTDTSGSVTASNVVYGNYKCELQNFTTTTWTILVPDTNATLNATGLITSTISVPNATVGYSQSVSDGRYEYKATNTPGTAGQVLTTDGASNYWSTVSGVGGGGIDTLKTNGTTVSAAATSLNLLAGSGLLNRTTNAAGVIDHQLLLDWTQAASQTNLTAASNALNTALVANDTTTSNALVTSINGKISINSGGGTNNSFTNVAINTINDYSGTNRMTFTGGAIQIYGSNGQRRVEIDDGGSVKLQATNSIGALEVGKDGAITTYFPVENRAAVTNASTLDTAGQTTFFGGAKYPTLTASRALVLNSSGNPTNAAGTPDGTKFLRDDNTYAVPSGGGSPGGNSGHIQFAEGTSFAGTNDFMFDRSNRIASLNGQLVVSNSVTPMSFSVSNGLAALVATNIFGAPTNTGLSLSNAVAALVGVQMISPPIYQWGNGWKTTATAASQPIGVQLALEPVQGTTTPTANWTVRFCTNGGGAGTFGANAAISLSSAGTLTAIGLASAGGSSISSGSGFSCGAAGGLLTGSGGAQFGGATIAFPGLFNTNGDLVVLGANKTFAGATNRLVCFGLAIGSTAAATVTNVLTASATLDFPATTVGTASDLPITVTGAADGDFVQVAAPQAAWTGIAGSYSGFASNNTVYVRFLSTGTAQDPASGTFKVLVTKVL